MFEKIDITDIIRDHVKSLRNEKRGTISLSEVFLFFIVPLLASILLVYFEFYLKDNMINILIASLSIFVGLLLNLLVLLVGMLDKCRLELKQQKSESKGESFFSYDLKTLTKRETLLKFSYNNISFAILVSLLSIPVMILALINDATVKLISNCLGYFLLLVFLVTLFMILKRVHVLLRTE